MSTHQTNRTVEHPDKQFTHGVFSSAVVTDDGWVYLSGQGPLDMHTGQRVAGSIEQETHLTLEHLEKILKQTGGSREHIVKCTCYLATLDDFQGFNDAYGAFFQGGPLPARTTVQAGLMKEIRVEIDAVAKLPKQR